MGCDYSVYYFCSRCQKRIFKGEAALNKRGGIICPVCNHRVRTHPPARKPQAKDSRGL